MGQSFLSKPVTDKESSDGSNDSIIYGASCMQGWRRAHEDAHNCIADFDTNTSYFAVYDGHGGQDVALYCSENLPQFLKKTEAYKNGDMKKALEDACLELDATIETPEVIEKLTELAQIKRAKVRNSNEEEEISESERKRSERSSSELLKTVRGVESGSTAVVALLRENELYIANVGDSRCILCRNGTAVAMSFDHKPIRKGEYERIVKAGGRVNNQRIWSHHGLNMSRAIGDYLHKQNKDLSNREQIIIALPDIQTLTINPKEDEFIFLACDGIWDRMSNQEVVDFIRPVIQEGNKKLSQICEELLDKCLKADSDDNMTAVLVQFKSHILKNSAEETEEPDLSKKLETEENSDFCKKRMNRE